MSRSPLSCALLVVAALLAAGAGDAAAQAGPCPVAVHILCVLASNTHEGTDTRLATVAHQLESSFHFTTYRLVSSQQAETRCGRTMVFTLPGGRILHVEPRGIDGNMITMQILLFQGERLIMATDVKMTNHGTLMVGGMRYEQGMLITSIAADTPWGSARPPLRSAATPQLPHAPGGPLQAPTSQRH